MFCKITPDDGRMFCTCGEWMMFLKIIITHRYFGYMDKRNGEYKERVFECSTCKRRFIREVRSRSKD